MQIEKYKCCKCDNKWENFAAPTGCHLCGSAYVEWLTYSDNKPNVQLSKKTKPKKRKRKK